MGNEQTVDVGTAIEIARQEEALAKVWTDDKVALLKRTIAKGASDDELALFVEISKRTGLNPFFRQLWAIPVWDSKLGREVMQFHVGIDGLRLIAARTEEYEGQLGPFWRAKGGQWEDFWDGDGPPYTAKVGVLRKGRREPFWGTVRYESFVRRNSKTGNPIGNWASMPDHMLAKCAEAQALRKAFPNETAGVNIAYEDEHPRLRYFDPDAPITRGQLGHLHWLSRELGMADEERHARAGVTSFVHLTKGRASELIEDWEQEVDAPTLGRRVTDEMYGPTRVLPSAEQRTEAAETDSVRAPDEGEPAATSTPSRPGGTLPRGESASRSAREEATPPASPNGEQSQDPAEDPIFEVASRYKGERVSVIAERDPAFLKGVIAGMRPGKRRDVYESWVRYYEPTLGGTS